MTLQKILDRPGSQVVSVPGLETTCPIISRGTFGGGLSLSLLRSIPLQLLSCWKWIERKRIEQVTNRRLKVSETVSLGDKRFVSIIRVDGTEFLIGGATASISLLAILKKEGSMSAASPNNSEKEQS